MNLGGVDVSWLRFGGVGSVPDAERYRWGTMLRHTPTSGDDRLMVCLRDAGGTYTWLPLLAAGGKPDVRLSEQGVVPGGSAGTDLTTDIQAVITANAGKRIIFDRPGETYHVNHLSVPSDTALIGYGATLFRDTTSSAGIDGGMVEVAENADNVLIAGLELQSSVAKRLIVAKGATRLLLRDVAVTAIGNAWATWFINCQDVLIDSYYQDAGTVQGRDGLHFSGGKNIAIQGCRIKSGDDPISFTLTDADGHTADTDMENISISNCVLTARQARLVNISTTNTDTATVRAVTISNVTGYSTPTTQSTRGFVLEGQATKSLADMTVADVTVDCTDASFGTGSGAEFNYIDGLKVSNLTVIKPMGYGIRLTGCTNARLSDCEARGARGGRSWELDGSPNTRLIGCRSVDAPSSNHHFQIGSNTDASDNCTLIGCEVDGSVVGVIGIYLRNSSHSTIIGNHLSGSGHGILEDASLADSNLILGNDVSGITGTKLTVAGANTWAGQNQGVSPSAYTVTNGTTDRTYDADTVAVAELADVVGTLISDLQAQGIVG